MGGIKYYQLAKSEEMPDEFCAVRDVGGEPSEYVFYVPEAENAKLREWCSELLRMAEANDPDFLHWPEIHDALRKLGVKSCGLK